MKSQSSPERVVRFYGPVFRAILSLLIVLPPLCPGGELIAQEVVVNGADAADESAADESAGCRLIVLGIAQDAGFPQAGCNKACCAAAWADENVRRNVVSLAVVDDVSGERFLFECTPDFPRQLRMLDQLSPSTLDPEDVPAPAISGIFVTHAHMGHYTGLMHLGREVMGASQVPVYTMPRMGEFLRTNGPWSQLVELENISLRAIQTGEPVTLTERLSVTAIQVPHRDEFSETVGFRICGPDKCVLFLPDIDKWGKWSLSIEDAIAECDVAYLDGTFFENGEIPGRDMALIPHPFVSESIARFSALEETERNKVRFIHFNHTNPVLQPDSAAATQIQRAGMHVAVEGEVLDL